ncbi:MAG: hypothetical protein ACQEP1_05215, partial [Nanobdellota archaeon]
MRRLFILLAVLLLFSPVASALVDTDLQYPDGTTDKDMEYDNSYDVDYDIWAYEGDYPVNYEIGIYDDGSLVETLEEGSTGEAMGGTVSIETKDIPEGAYTARLSTTDFTGGTDTSEVTFTLSQPIVTISPSYAELYPSETGSFTATGGSSGEYEWSIIEGAQRCSVDDGTVTADSEGSCTVKAEDTGSPSYDTADIEVKAMPSMSITPSGAELYPGQEQDFTASGSTGDVSWSISSGDSQCSIDSSGTLTAEAEGSCTVRADDMDSPAYAEAAVTVLAKPNIGIDPSSVSMYEGEEQDFSLTGADKAIWSVSNDNCGLTVTADDEVTVSGENTGSCTLTAEHESGAEAEADIEITELPSVDVMPDSVFIYRNQVQTFASNKDVTWSFSSG